MLQSTFIHVPGIGIKTEQRLWEDGWTTWQSFQETYQGSKRSLILPYLNTQDLFERLDKLQAWRLYPHFRGKTAFLDIETDGYSDKITCIGLYDGKTARTFVAGRDLMDFYEAMQPYEFLVTFNGAQFDLPILAKQFPGLDLQRKHHCDLRFALRRLGLRGGLKSIEHQLGIGRGNLAGLNGWSAVLLWRMHQRGHKGALPTLERYNLEDILNLEPLLCHVYNHHATQPPLNLPPLLPAERPSLAQQVDDELVGWLIGQQEKATAQF